MATILAQLQSIFERICALPAGEELANLVREYACLAEEVKDAIGSCQVKDAEIRAIYPYIHATQVLVQAALKQETICAASEQSFRAELSKSLASGSTQAPSAGDEDMVNYDIWRQWYSDHVTHPYYDSRERDWLLKQIPGMTPQKMQTWFVNVRRRSGWSELYRKYADNKRENMEAIFAACDDSDPSISNKVAPEARKLVAKIRQYLTLESKKTEVAPWLSDLLDSYKNKSLKKESPAPSSTDDEVKPVITSSAASGKHRRNQKRKASDEKTNITTPYKRAKPSLYTTPHHPTLSTSSSSPSLHNATPLYTKASSAIESMSPLQRSMNSSSPDLQIPPTITYAQSENNAEQYTIPPFNAWTPPSQAAYIQPLSAFVPAQAHQVYASLSPQHGSMLQVSSGQSFTANNNTITYNIASPMSYSYAQQGPVAVQAQAWNHHHQPQWSYMPVQATSHQLSPTMTSYPSSSYAMLANLSTTHPGKRKYIPEDDEMPATPTGSYKRGRTSMSMYSEPSMAECYIESNFGDREPHQAISVEPYMYGTNQ